MSSQGSASSPPQNEEGRFVFKKKVEEVVLHAILVDPQNHLISDLNRSAIGASVLVRHGDKVQAQAVLSQASFYSCNDPRSHFGLGNFGSADIEVFWPSSLHEKFKPVGAKQLVTLREGVGIVPSKDWVER